MSGPSPAEKLNAMLPKDWWKAPAVWRRQEPDAFYIFLVVNFFFGTLGIWLPLVNSLLGGHSPITTEMRKLFTSGGFYTYAVPFLAATVGVVITSMKQRARELSSGTKVLFFAWTLPAFVACVVLLQIQVLGPAESLENVNFFLQVVVSLMMVYFATCIHAVVQNERGSPQEDMQQEAAALAERARTAVLTAEDFK